MKEKEFYKKLREDEDDSWWTNICIKMAEKANVEPTKPRNVQRNSNKANAPADTAQQYYKRNVYLPLLDHIAMELDTQFTSKKR